MIEKIEKMIDELDDSSITKMTRISIFLLAMGLLVLIADAWFMMGAVEFMVSPSKHLFNWTLSECPQTGEYKGLPIYSCPWDSSSDMRKGFCAFYYNNGIYLPDNAASPLTNFECHLIGEQMILKHEYCHFIRERNNQTEYEYYKEEFVCLREMIR